MSDVIFCKTRYQDIGYHSYNDLWKMVEWAGYPIIYVDQIDPQSDNTYIFTPANGETVNGWPDAKAEIILWQLEWMLTDEHNTPPGVKRVWASDAWLAKQHGFEYVPMGGDTQLNEWPDTWHPQKQYDVALLSYQTHRRQIITQQMVDAGLGLAPVSGLWGSVRSTVLMQSRAMVHVHQNEGTPGIAPLRWCLAAAHQLPMISETVADRGIFGYSRMVSADYSFLTHFTASMLKDDRLLADYASALYALLCVDYTFQKGIERHV